MNPFKMSMWNIQGIRSSLYGPKCNSKDFLENTIDFDFLNLQETWCRTDTDIPCTPNDIEIFVPSVKNPGIKRGRDSGGIIIWHKSEISKHTTIINSETTFWIKISKNISGTDRDWFQCTVYIPPIDSPNYSEETFPNLHTQICRFQAQGIVPFCGDLNTRTGCRPDSNPDNGNVHIFGQKFPQNTTNLPRLLIPRLTRLEESCSSCAKALVCTLLMVGLEVTPWEDPPSAHLLTLAQWIIW